MFRRIFRSHYARRGFKWGIVIGAILLVGITLEVVRLSMENGFSGESVVYWTYLAVALSFPTTFWINLLFGFVVSFLRPVWLSALLGSFGFPLLVAGVLLNWALIGAAIGVAVGKVRDLWERARVEEV